MNSLVLMGKLRPKDGSSPHRGLLLRRGRAGPDLEASLSMTSGRLPWAAGLTCVFSGPLSQGREIVRPGCLWCGAWPRAECQGEPSVEMGQGGVTGDTVLPVPDSATQRAPPALSRAAGSRGWGSGQS